MAVTESRTLSPPNPLKGPLIPQRKTKNHEVIMPTHPTVEKALDQRVPPQEAENLAAEFVVKILVSRDSSIDI